MESAVPRYHIPGRRKQGYRGVRCPPTADVKSRSVIGETIQKLTRKDPVSRRGRLRWLRRQQKLVGAAGRRARDRGKIKVLHDDRVSTTPAGWQESGTFSYVGITVVQENDRVIL
ncbi:Hypp4086 [Branchiostoma lanceolatum]|uniref:Hypp4086 protein n=1 Tax=Branchiostoma lanceolatum TaxID=7740 RepID=A0A8K0A770_BRALA|nr:Hypp4086 [Branchiostoma lanceolatum]